MHIPNYNTQDYIAIGDLDMTGNTITVEALFAADTNYFIPSTVSYDLVSKHTDPSNCNYLLRPVHVGITTTNGFFDIASCDYKPRKINHAALVYDGSTLKFYRNGFLMGSKPASGNLVTNDLITKIGNYADGNDNGALKGYMNEVRIWNIARTENEIKTYMYAPLPNPTTQTGLVAYYQFDNLNNKQGNATWNGTLNGAATINNSVPDCNFIADSCFVPAADPCNNWLFNPSASSAVNIGDLDIPGNKVTVEAMINRTTPYLPGGLDNSEGDVVSKHNSPADVNYVLRPNHGYVTTTDGFFATPDVCEIELNKTYHIAMVYDGSTLKYYRDGYLLSQVNATGNLILNNWNTRIGHYDPAFWLTQFVGYTNEVRIWNVARTQTELRTYMNTSLPNPTTQTGLLGYYVFDNLTNRQGNAAFNGVINGGAVINSTNTSCSFSPDSCAIITSVPGISGIINAYTPVISFSGICENKITVEDASAFKAGDTILIIQMKGAVIDSSNTANFGTITDYKNAGNYEFNYVQGVSGNVVEIKNTLTRQYDVPDGLVQLVRVPYYKSVSIIDTLTCLAWDGRKGGVLVLNVQDTVNMQADISVNGRGFHGGEDPVTNPAVFNCFENNFYYPVNPDLASQKGEGIAVISPLRSYGKGALANGGGGGNSHNSAGGGGGNAGAGGMGGFQYEGSPCNTTVPFNNRGIGGNALTLSNTANKIFLGGGGGAGQSNNLERFQATGGNGSGIAIIKVDNLQSNSHAILAQGKDGLSCGNAGSGCHEGMGGGGAGGACLLYINNYIDNAVVNNTGGKGADMEAAGFGRVGPGGGGGAGIAWIKQASLPANISLIQNGGLNGVCTGYSNDVWGAQAGQNGITVFDLAIPFSNVPFRKNIDSVRIRDSITSCLTIDLKGLPYINTHPIQNWQWSFGDNTSASTQNTSHTYTNAGNYTVKVVATDINGCKDSTTRTITVASCADTVINSYAAVLAIDICNNTLTVDDPAKFNAGDTIVIMQMKGAAIDSSNIISFGTISNYNNAGKFEFNYVKSKTGSTIEFKNTFLNNYDAAQGRVQLIRVPYFQSFTVNNNLTCPAWDGAKGGVLILNSATNIILNGPIDVSNKGFRGGAVGGGFSCGNVSDWSGPTGMGGTKGEGITEYITGFEAGGAKLANGGGGAYAANSGGGGGGNFGAGGLGGFHSNTCPSATQSINGEALNYTAGDRIFMGGAGGGGQQDNGAPVAAGGNGGGIVIIKAATLNSNNQKIITNGENVTTIVQDEGGAGGGAGGSVLLFVNNYAGNLSIDANGGSGSSNNNQIYPTRCHGPGGGGGGGFIGTSATTLPAVISTTLTGGTAGSVLNPNSACAGTTNGAANGNDGGSKFNLVIPEATVPFKKNIDSVSISETLASCKTFDFNGIAYTNTSAIQKWEWNFDNVSTANGQSTSYTYPNYGTHRVKLVATDINGCKDSVSKIATTNGINFDFVFEQDVCNPLNVRFKAVGDTTAEIYWSKGDGTVITTIRNPAHQYANPGSYLIEYCTGNASTGCIDTVRKTIYIGWTNANIVLTPDTTICFGTSKLLRSSIDSTLGFCWSPVSFLNNSGLANPTTNTPSTITYQLLAVNEENNLIPNGDFSTGNTLFTSDYTEGTAPLSSTEYFVGTSSLNAGPSAATCNDHTTGTGNMMVVRNDFSANAQIWGQTVNVTPNTTYTFSAWFQSLFTTSNAQLQLSINGNAVKDSIALSTTTCTWQKYSVIWNSGTSTTANFAIKSKANTSGNDDYFAIDDIKLALYSIKQDTVRISVDTPFIDTRTDTSVCESIAVTLNTSGAVTYSWTPAAGLSSTSVANPVATPTDTTKYFVTGTNAFGCQATDSVTISVKPKPVVTSTGDTLICRNTSVTLFATGGGSYFWSPATSLDNPVSPNPITNPTTVNTKYVVVVIGVNNCISKDSFTVNVTRIPAFTISADKSVCLNTKPQLNATGGNYYLWSPTSLVSDPNISNPLALTNNTTLYSVLIKDTTCGDVTTLTTNISILPAPTVTAAKENDINCAIGSTVLTAAGALQYAWTPTSTLDNATTATPIASPVNTTTYTVTGTDANGCSNSASVTVLADYSARVSYVMPNAFTPNGDGYNDCFRVKYFGLIQELQFVIYNRWGEKVFFTTNPNECWDGTYKGSPCDQGNFVYHIKAKTTCGPVERKGNVLLVR